MSLKAVETATGGSINAAILGAYERGEHSITAARLLILSRLYDVPLEDLVGPVDRNVAREPEMAAPIREELRFDIAQLDQARGREAQAVARLVRVIEGRRHRKTVEAIEVRYEDLVTAAATLGSTVDSFIVALRRAGVLRRPRGRPPGSAR